MKRLLRLSAHLKTSIILSWKASPWMFLFRICFELISVAIPIAMSLLTKKTINNLSTVKSMDLFTVTVLLMVILHLISALLGKLSSYVNGVHSDTIGNLINRQIINKINSLDISFFDNPEFYNEVQLAIRDSQSLQGLTWIITSIIKGVTQIVSCGIILGRLNIYIPIILIALNIPSFFIDQDIAKKQYEWMRSKAENERKINYISTILQSKAYAKDVRVFNTKDYFFNKYVFLWKEWFTEKNRMARRKLSLSFLASMLPYFGTIFVLVYVGTRIIGGILTLGDFTFFNSMTSQLVAGLSTIISSFNKGYESEMRLSHYSDFLAWKTNVEEEGFLPLTHIDSIDFVNVSFIYPNTEKTVLKNINLHIGKNEKLAVVGVNGAGKSTLVKLLLRLYDPAGGEILINGINIKEYDINSLRYNFGVVFQDYNKYSLTLRETISLTNLQEKENDEKIIKACENADIDIKTDARFAGGLETQLGKSFDKKGVEMSGGQWQKIAISQAYFKNNNFMIMDEPNAALDPDAENKVFIKMQELCKDKGAIIITHRMSSVFMADKIILINNGVVEEEGTHEALMKNNGLYKDLFSKQADKFTKAVNPCI